MNLGKETKVQAQGKTWTLGRLTVGVLEQFRDWISLQVGDPFADVERFVDKLAKEDAVAMIKEAKAVKDQLAKFSLSCDLARQYLSTERGAAQLIWLLMVEHHPDASLDDALAVILAIGAERLGGVVRSASGEVLGARPGNAPAPPPARATA